MKKLTNKEMGARIEAARTLRGWSQQDLCNALAEIGLPVTRSAVSQWETGDTTPKATYVYGLAKVFDISAETLLFATEKARVSGAARRN